MGSPSEIKSLLRELDRLKPHDHLCLIYESPDEWEETIIPFIRIGLERGEKCLYVTATHTAEEIRERLTEAGINVPEIESRGQLSILLGDEVYTAGGCFDPDRMIQRLINETEKAVGQGYPALRVTGEMTWALKGVVGSERFLEYAAKLNRDFFPKYPCLAICQYERWQFGSEIIWSAILTHPKLIHGTMVSSNLYHVPFEEITNDVRPEMEVKHWLNNIAREEKNRRELIESETRYRRLFETAQDGILLVDAKTGQIFDINPYLEKILGCTYEECVHKKLWDICAFRDIDSSKKAFAKLQREGYIRYEMLPLITKDGKEMSVEFVSNTYKVDGEEVIQCNIRDITNRKHAEDDLVKSRELLEVRVKERTADLREINKKLVAEIRGRTEAERELRISEGKLRRLSRHLDSMIEKEKEQISREVHDELGQALVALQMDLQWMEKRLPEREEPLRRKIKSMLEFIDTTSQVVRDISTRLRPRFLDDLGIVAAIEWQMKEFQARTGIKCRIVISPKKIDLDADCAVTLLRILQEGLTNVAQHAEATKVSVTLKKVTKSVILKVKDNGKGISGESIHNPGALGLLGIRERAAAYGGNVRISGIPGKGTTLVVSIPLNKENGTNAENTNR
jgi:PAS domain S-box-containing protein